MGHVRAGTRLIALAVFCTAYYSFLRVGDLWLRLTRRLRGVDTSTAGWRTAVFASWSRSICRILGMRVEVRGRPPQPPFFLVANHLGYIDVVLLASRLPCVFVAKSEILQWPFIGAMCRAVDTVFIDRGRKRDIPRVMDAIERTFREGRGVVVFPEGTSTRGAGVERFRPSLLAGAARAGWPVSWASLSYRTASGYTPAHLSVCWWGDMTFGGHFVRMLGLPGFRALVTFGEEPIVESDRKILATRLQRAVERRFQPVVGS